MIFSKTSNPFDHGELRTSALIKGKIIPETDSKSTPKENKSPGFFGKLKYAAEEVETEVKKVGKEFESGAKKVGKEVGKEVKRVGKEVKKVGKEVKNVGKEVVEGAKYVEEKVVDGAKYVEKEVKSGLMTFSPETPNNTDVNEAKTPNTTSTENKIVADKQVEEKVGSGTFLRNEAENVVQDAKQEIKNFKKEFEPCDFPGHYTEAT